MLNIHSHQSHNGSAVNPSYGRASVTSFNSGKSTTASEPLLALIGRLAAQTDTQQGWLFVIAPPQPLTKAMLSRMNINSKRILVIQQRQIGHFDNLMRDALTCSTCCAVISFLPTDYPQLADYQYLSAKYGTALVNLNADQQQTLNKTH